MREVKHDREEEVIHRLAAEFVRNESTGASLLTITRVELNVSGKDVIIYFSTLPESAEDAAQKFLDRKTKEFKIFLRDKSRIGMLPHIRFRIDYGERNRQRMDELSGNIK